MSAEELVRVAREGLYLAILVAAPAVLGALLAGFVVSLLQATTQIQEPTLTFAPRVLGVAVALVVAGPWIGGQLVRFTTSLLEAVPRVS
jgi:flagellar biosynthetic protein FliQ